jgi:hypothetical protein
MFGRLLIALGLKKKAVSRVGGVVRLQAAATGSMSVGGAMASGRTAASSQRPRQPASKSAPTRRRTNLDDDGFPQTMISSFPESENPRPRSLARVEDDVPIPFRSHGGGEFGGGGGSASWAAKTSSGTSCWGGESDADAPSGRGGASSSSCDSGGSDSGSSSTTGGA